MFYFRSAGWLFFYFYALRGVTFLLFLRAPRGLFSFAKKKIGEKKSPKGEDSDFFPLWKPLIETAKGNASFPFDTLRVGGGNGVAVS